MGGLGAFWGGGGRWGFVGGVWGVGVCGGYGDLKGGFEGAFMGGMRGMWGLELLGGHLGGLYGAVGYLGDV